MTTRRGLLKSIGAMALAGMATTAYAGWIEPMWLTRLTIYRFRPPGFGNGLQLRIAVLADIHACDPWMSEDRIRKLVVQTNALNADLIVLLGDYVEGMPWLLEVMEPQRWASALAGLKASLGVYAVTGNND